MYPENTIALIWHIVDVQAVRPDLTDEQALDVLIAVLGTHDASIGVNWQILESVAEMLFPPPDEFTGEA